LKYNTLNIYGFVLRWCDDIDIHLSVNTFPDLFLVSLFDATIRQQHEDSAVNTAQQHFIPLDGYKLTGSCIGDARMVITLESLTPPPQECPNTQPFHVSDYRSWSSSIREVRDLPIDGMPVTLKIKRSRYRCHKCHATAMQELPGIHQRGHTQRLIDAVVQDGLANTFQTVADRLHLPFSTVSWICAEQIAQWDATYLPRRLDHLQRALFSWLDNVGITTGKGPGHHVCVVANAETSTLVDIIDIHQAGVDAVLAAYVNTHLSPPQRKLIHATIPPWEGLRTALRQRQSDCRITLDPFALGKLAETCALRARFHARKTASASQLRHLTQDADLLLTRRGWLTKDDVNRLALWETKAPIHFAAYQSKEAAFDIYQVPGEAPRKLRLLVQSLRGEMVPGFEQLLQVLTDWEEEILSFFEEDVITDHTPAYVASFRSHLPELGLAHSYQSARARLLYGTGTMPTSTEQYGPSIHRRNLDFQQGNA